MDGQAANVDTGLVTTTVERATDRGRLEPFAPGVRSGRVLYIEDDNDLRLAVRLALVAEGWEVVEASSAFDGLEALARCDPDVVLLDLGLPDGSGGDVLQRIKHEPSTAWLPVVVLSGLSRPDQVVTLLRAGAQDYLVKPVDPDELEARLGAARRVSTGHRQLVAKELQLQHLADHDPLTGVFNRRGFQAELDRHAARSARYGHTGALLLIDVDHFKTVNDTVGHGGGDEMLTAVAALLSASVRDTDVVARFGGDEFAVLLPQADAATAAVVARHLAEAVDAGSTTSSSHRLHLTISVGGACFDDTGLTSTDVLRRADAAMYEAKDAGRNGWVIAATSPVDGVATRVAEEDGRP